MKSLRLVPCYGVAAGLILFAVASAQYPGGTHLSPLTVGYSWSGNFISALFAPLALNGEPNPARLFAAAALLCWCISLAISFKWISSQASSRVHRSVIEIAGIGAAVYALLVATPMHNLMVTIGLVFSLTALLTTVHMLFSMRVWLLFSWGLVCLGLSTLSASLYYSGVGYDYLPIVQKLNVMMVVSWVLTVGYAELGGNRAPRALHARST